jgi:hypothetical protein
MRSARSLLATVVVVTATILQPGLAAGQGSSAGPVRVQLIILDPTLPGHGGQRLSTFMHWNDPDALNGQLIDEMAGASHGRARYQVAERRLVDEFPAKIDGYRFDEGSYLACLADGSTCHQPQNVDYVALLNEFGSCEKRDKGRIDETWVWGAPGFGFWESTLAGDGAFWFNSSPVEGSTCHRLLPIMGFNYERTVDLAMHSYGHRMESTMDHAFGYRPNNPWRRYIRYDAQLSGQGACGNVHFPPNGTSDYDYGNNAQVSSSCDSWSNWPAAPGASTIVSCATWGCSQLGYMRWWLGHLPTGPGATNGVANDWWQSILLRRCDAACSIPRGQQILIDPSDYVEGAWSEYGPAYEANPVIVASGATHAHVFGRSVGSFAYEFIRPTVIAQGAELSARLSSEFPYYSAPADGYSDVSLFVNNVFLGTQRVLPDNGSGAIYRWPFDPSRLRTGTNRIDFVVSGSQAYVNGLCIYGQALAPGAVDQPITLQFS